MNPAKKKSLAGPMAAAALLLFACEATYLATLRSQESGVAAAPTPPQC